jgi:hypothetical protein
MRFRCDSASLYVTVHIHAKLSTLYVTSCSADADNEGSQRISAAWHLPCNTSVACTVCCWLMLPHHVVHQFRCSANFVFAASWDHSAAEILADTIHIFGQPS